MRKRSITRITAVRQMFGVSAVTQPFAVSGPRARVVLGRLPQRGFRVHWGKIYALSDPELGTCLYQDRIVFRPLRR